jgi:hypothetical protein
VHDYLLQSIFDEGELHEQDMLKQLMSMYKVVKSQQAFQLDDPLITGHVDAVILHEGEEIPVDVKSVNSHIHVKTVDDLVNSKHIHLRNYPAQMQMYMYFLNAKTSFLCFKNKDTGEPTDIWIDRDEAMIIGLIDKARVIYASIREKEPPARCDEYEVCSKCPFRHVCLPELKYGQEIKMIGEEWVEKLERREVLDPYKREYDDIDKELNSLKDNLGAGEFMCGDFIVKIKKVEKTNKVPKTWDEVKSSYLKKEIINVKGEEKTPEKWEPKSNDAYYQTIMSDSKG